MPRLQPLSAWLSREPGALKLNIHALAAGPGGAVRTTSSFTLTLPSSPVVGSAPQTPHLQDRAHFALY